MIKPRRLMEMARKWRKAASIGRRRITFQRSNIKYEEEKKCSEMVAEKGHFVVYSFDEKRFVIPLKFLSTEIFKELFRMSAEEFGLPGNGPITLPCDAVFMEYVISLVRGHASKDLEKALLDFMAINGRCGSSSSFSAAEMRQQHSLHAF